MVAKVNSKHRLLAALVVAACGASSLRAASSPDVPSVNVIRPGEKSRIEGLTFEPKAVLDDDADGVPVARVRGALKVQGRSLFLDAKVLLLLESGTPGPDTWNLDLTVVIGKKSKTLRFIAVSPDGLLAEELVRLVPEKKKPPRVVAAAEEAEAGLGAPATMLRLNPVAASVVSMPAWEDGIPTILLAPGTLPVRVLKGRKKGAPQQYRVSRQGTGGSLVFVVKGKEPAVMGSTLCLDLTERSKICGEVVEVRIDGSIVKLAGSNAQLVVGQELGVTSESEAVAP